MPPKNAAYTLLTRQAGIKYILSQNPFINILGHKMDFFALLACGASSPVRAADEYQEGRASNEALPWVIHSICIFLPVVGTSRHICRFAPLTPHDFLTR